MRAIVAEAIDAGALGFATSKSTTHVGYGGRPVPEPRGRRSPRSPTIAGALGEAGPGVIQATMGAGFAFAEFADITRATGRSRSRGRPCSAGLGGPGGHPDAARRVRQVAGRRGCTCIPQVSCRPLNFEFTMAEPFPFESMTLFAPISAAADLATKAEIYADPAFRTAFREQLASRPRRGARRQLGAHRLSWFPPDPDARGHATVAALAAARGVDPSDLVLDLALESGLEARFRMAVLNFDEDEVEMLLTDPHTMLGPVRCRRPCQPAVRRVLLRPTSSSRWVRERRALTLEDGRAQADLRARRDLRHHRPGHASPRGARPTSSSSTPTRWAAPTCAGCTTSPPGADRLVADASGIGAVMVNGVVIRRDGADVVDATGPLPGRLLRHGSAA